MKCRDVREVGDSFLSAELLTETNHEVLQHLDLCSSCRAELDARRRLRDAVRTAFHRVQGLQPRLDFAERLRGRLRESAVPPARSSRLSSRWLALAAGLLFAAGLTATIFLNESTAPDESLARDAIESHRNCALKYRLFRTPMPLEEAAHRFDTAFRLLLSAPPDDISTPDGPARVIDRHSCVYGTRRFGHVVMEYQGRVVSLLMTANDAAPAAAESLQPGPQVIDYRDDGLSVVAVDGTRHAILLVSDLETAELADFSRIVSLPLVQHVGSLIPIRGVPSPVLLAQSVRAAILASDGVEQMVMAAGVDR